MSFSIFANKNFKDANRHFDFAKKLARTRKFYCSISFIQARFKLELKSYLHKTNETNKKNRDYLINSGFNIFLTTFLNKYSAAYTSFMKLYNYNILLPNHICKNE